MSKEQVGSVMDNRRHTATNISDVIGNVQEVQDSAKDVLQRRIRYLSKKHYLRGGREIDKRGTLDFPFSEVFRAAIYCEFLALSMDIKVASAALQKAEELRFVPGNYPVSMQTDGGWRFDDGGLAAAVHGVGSGEEWLLVIEIKRSGENGNAGMVAHYTVVGHQKPNVDVMLGSAVTATTLTISLEKLFTGLLNQLKDAG